MQFPGDKSDYCLNQIKRMDAVGCRPIFCPQGAKQSLGYGEPSAQTSFSREKGQINKLQIKTLSSGGCKPCKQGNHGRSSVQGDKEIKK